MGQIFRITFEQQDYMVKLVNTLSINRDTTQFDLILDDVSYCLIKSNSNWSFANVEDPQLLKLSAAIGKAISLRYRL